ncbi:hypothetical protein MHU86_17544 [Fragilaria crotonensis]|nr:hypothetical protein MHU86_17544 [Fragilaria crotonensis]
MFCIIGCLIDYLAGAPVCCGCFFNVAERRPNLPSNPVSTPISSIEHAAPTSSIDNARSRRPLILATLFPKEGHALEGSGPPDGHGSLKYNSQSKRYVFCEDAPDATACSICLEVLVPADDSVTGSCSHVYHRKCIMNWLHGDHDICPNCRQPMWDPETYKIIDECIKAQQSNSSFVV